MIWLRTFLILLLLLCGILVPAQDRAYNKSLALMGSVFEITVVASTQEEAWANSQIDMAIGEIRRIERLISSWEENSQTAEINRNAGNKPVKVDPELFDLIDRSKKISNLTGGAFDLTFSSMIDLWRFDGSMEKLPSDEEIAGAITLIGHTRIILDKKDTTVFLDGPGMKIGFGGIGKGYAANRARDLLLRGGVKSGVIRAGNDLLAWGAQPGGEPWKIGIASPSDTETVAAWFNIDRMAVATSGDYDNFITLQGKKYSHIIDPRTGWPARGLKSVTVVCSNAELADALTTALFVMGREAGLELVNQLNGIECLFVDDLDRIWVSKSLVWSREQTVLLNFVIGR